MKQFHQVIAGLRRDYPEARSLTFYPDASQGPVLEDHRYPAYNLGVDGVLAYLPGLDAIRARKVESLLTPAGALNFREWYSVASYILSGEVPSALNSDLRARVAIEYRNNLDIYERFGLRHPSHWYVSVEE